jgi:hypothetical protein
MTLLTELQRCLLLVPSFIAYVLIVVKRTQDSWNAGTGQVDCSVCLRACLGAAAAGLQQSQWSSAAVGAVCVCVLSRSQLIIDSCLCVCHLHFIPLDFWPSCVGVGCFVFQ